MFDDNQIIGSNVFGASIFGYYWMYLDWRRRNRKVREAKIGKSEGQCLNKHTFRTTYWIFVLLVWLQRASKVLYNAYFIYFKQVYIHWDKPFGRMLVFGKFGNWEYLGKMFEQRNIVNQPTEFRISSTMRTALKFDTVSTPDLFRTTEYLGSTSTLKVYMY